jgi:hypothetical protein
MLCALSVHIYVLSISNSEQALPLPSFPTISYLNLTPKKILNDLYKRSYFALLYFNYQAKLCEAEGGRIK